MSSTTTLPGVDFTTLSRRRHVEQALNVVRAAKRQADADSTKTIRECNLDAVVRTTTPSQRTPQAITASWPPPSVLVAAALALVILVGGLLSLGSSAQLLRSQDGGVIAGSSSQWRDGVEAN